MSEYRVHENGEPNDYTILDEKTWVAHVLFNGELTVERQRGIIQRVLKEANDAAAEGAIRAKPGAILAVVDMVYAAMQHGVEFEFLVQGAGLVIKLCKRINYYPYAVMMTIPMMELAMGRDPVGFMEHCLKSLMEKLDRETEGA